MSQALALAYRIRRERKSFADLAAVYRHQQLHLLARSAEHQRVLRQAWQEPLWVVEDWNLADLAQAVPLA